MSESDRRARFEQLAVPLLDDAMHVAAWLARSRSDADDIVQEAMLRAYKYLDRFSGSAFRPWLMAIVRNTAITWLRRNRSENVAFVPDLQSVGFDGYLQPAQDDCPERLLLERDLADQINRAVAQLPAEYREVIILRELHDLSYKEIATIVGAPIGTVMSRLSRARRLLIAALPEQPL